MSLHAQSVNVHLMFVCFCVFRLNIFMQLFYSFQGQSSKPKQNVQICIHVEVTLDYTTASCWFSIITLTEGRYAFNSSLSPDHSGRRRVHGHLSLRLPRRFQPRLQLRRVHQLCHPALDRLRQDGNAGGSMHTRPDGHLSVPYKTHSTVTDRHLKLGAFAARFSVTPSSLSPEVSGHLD